MVTMVALSLSLPLTKTTFTSSTTKITTTNKSTIPTNPFTTSSSSSTVKRKIRSEQYHPRSMRKHTAMSFILSVLMILTVPVVTYLHPGSLALAQAAATAAAQPSTSVSQSVPSIAASSPSPSLGGSTTQSGDSRSSSSSINSNNGSSSGDNNSDEEDLETFLIISPYETNSLLRRPSCEHTQTHLQFTNTVRFDGLMD